MSNLTDIKYSSGNDNISLSLNTASGAATYNISTMSQEEDPNESERFEQKLKSKKWDVVGMCEITNQTGHVFYQNNAELTVAE